MPLRWWRCSLVAHGGAWWHMVAVLEVVRDGGAELMR